jgi:hypothetical protein
VFQVFLLFMVPLKGIFVARPNGAKSDAPYDEELYDEHGISRRPEADA